MSYQVLARKWRPNSFAELVGQEHVVSAISNALDNNRLHHAYLFSGTRGVGKTTIARIFSKSLNCEVGLSATPCGKCSTCVEIEQGNFIDMLEIDAASRTKVEDTRELLDNVQYRPSRGRYKVYLIDEVHMLSKHSFNALLKTLEEPPPHVKFLLATTDPQKLPVTILSRCLQFNLKALSRSQISQQLAYVLEEEQLSFDTEALSQLSRAAQGSMRDALSLTDQAIAQGNGVVSLSVVTDMLGLMDKNIVLKLLSAVLKKNSTDMMQLVDSMAMQSADFTQVIAELMSLLHQVALTQLVPQACKLETIAARAIYQIAKSVPPEHIQLLYQIALNGKKDMPHAADPRSGLEMTLLRMLAFCPDNISLEPKEIAELAKNTATHEPTQINDSKNALTEGSSSDNSLSNTDQETSLPALTQAVNQSPDDALLSPEKKITQNELESNVKSSFSNNQSDQPHEAETKYSESNYPEGSYSEDEDKDNNLADSAYEQSLFDEQQSIIQQASDYGYNEQTEQVASSSASENDEPSTGLTLSTTETMIALRKKLQQSQLATEEKTNAGKKSEKTELPNLASIRQSSETLPNESLINSPEVEPSVIDMGLNAPQNGPLTPDELSGDLPPPWNSDNTSFSTEKVAPLDIAEQQTSKNKIIETYTAALDAHGHLALDDIGEVDFDIPVFLDDRQKVTSAVQVDDWSRLIDTMQVTALTKQLALHSSFERESAVVKLTLLNSKVHLDTPSARQQLKEALSQTLQTDIELEITLGHPINTPFAVQHKVNTLRQEYACRVINEDPNILLLHDLFAAEVDPNSIVPR